MTVAWDPAQYARFAAERARPFHDLVNRIDLGSTGGHLDRSAEGLSFAARQVVDLGCGTGELTASLSQRWPDADILGIDFSESMLTRAARHAGGTVHFRQERIEDWVAPGPVTVIISNAALQWVPDHLSRLPGWLSALRPGGVLAFQVPAMSGSPAGETFSAVAGRPRWKETLAEVSGPTVAAGGGVIATVAQYLDVLGAGATRVEGWETTYHHVLPGDDPVLEWFSGTGLRPFLAALDEPARSQFRAEVAQQLRVVYPRRRYGTVLPFRRIFILAYR